MYLLSQLAFVPLLLFVLFPLGERKHVCHPPDILPSWCRAPGRQSEQAPEEELRKGRVRKIKCRAAAFHPVKYLQQGPLSLSFIHLSAHLPIIHPSMHPLSICLPILSPLSLSLIYLASYLSIIYLSVYPSISYLSQFKEKQLKNFRWQKRMFTCKCFACSRITKNHCCGIGCVIFHTLHSNIRVKIKAQHKSPLF